MQVQDVNSTVITHFEHGMPSLGEEFSPTEMLCWPTSTTAPAHKGDTRMHAYLARMATLRSIGMGALYFFTSHMVIRSMFYVGTGKTPEQIVVFFLLLLCSVAVVHTAPHAFLDLRARASEYIRMPLVSMLAALGSFLLVLSILPEMGCLPLYLGGVLAGLACGCLVTTWAASLHVSHPNPRSFSIPPELIWAVVFYFCFRVASSFSPMVSEGVLFTLPLLAVAYLSSSRAASQADAQDSPADDEVEASRASLVLVYVSAAFALASAIVVYMAGLDSLQLGSGLNHMVLFELVLVGVVICTCSALGWLARQPVLPRRTAAFVSVLLVLPPFAIGVAMGAVFQPESAAGLMWETSFWVMFVAVFAYDMRYSPYLCDGLAVGLMFESMCVAQLSTQLALHLDAPAVVVRASVTVGVLYLAGTFRQLLRPEALASSEGIAHKDAIPTPEGKPGFWGTEEPGHIEPQDALSARCATLARTCLLTPSERDVLELLAHGRSARYVADELGVSFNTVRTHIRHVYEKLGIHSRQDLIDLVEIAQTPRR